MSSYISFLLGALFIWFVQKVIALRQRRYSNAPYPPGPKPKPLIGNALDFPTSRAPETYLEWGKKYQSDFVFGSALGTSALVLNKLEDADELLDRRARKYSDRPALPVLKLSAPLRMDWEWNVAAQRYGLRWRFHRTLCQQHFRAVAARNYYPHILEKTHDMLGRLLRDPEHFEEHNKMLSISLPMATMYGYNVQSFDDPCIVAADESTRLGTSLVIPGGTWINVIPALAKIPSWFPGAWGVRSAKKVRELTNEIQRIPLEFVKKAVENGSAVPSLVGDFLKRKKEGNATEEEEDAILNIANTVYSGAFYYLMAINPEIQKKAQDEIDRVVGTGRLPNFDDRPALPYVEALYREVLRLAPPVPLGLPHTLTEDDYYKGYFIPKGALSNAQWFYRISGCFGHWLIYISIYFDRAMSRDEELHQDPLVFKPERYLDERGNLRNDTRVIAYGFGRRLNIAYRVCAGKHIASATVWMAVASVLACFNIGKAKDDLGNELDIKDDYDDFGVLRHKTQFKCTFVPRSSAIQDLIHAAP
ncbi:hypothetical protein CVT26_014659 [Gymnopilus dilepis]|uniref:Cytochrome P450 n=1 Tax=Gymnopilus dilepis TaxID=231916 RepID=A0A409W3F5_9AGAR|nr:hypothetical protein CVT26_014659 [Gymnopilus dilepis]